MQHRTQKVKHLSASNTVHSQRPAIVKAIHLLRSIRRAGIATYVALLKDSTIIIMTTDNITMKSTKAQIIESAEELISSLEFQLDVSKKRVKNQKQDLRILVVLLALLFILSPIIY